MGDLSHLETAFYPQDVDSQIAQPFALSANPTANQHLPNDRVCRPKLKCRSAVVLCWCGVREGLDRLRREFISLLGEAALVVTYQLSSGEYPGSHNAGPFHGCCRRRRRGGRVLRRAQSPSPWSEVVNRLQGLRRQERGLD